MLPHFAHFGCAGHWLALPGWQWHMFATYLLANYLYFQVFGCVSLFKLASAGQFAKTE
jgi:hypothetical protein